MARQARRPDPLFGPLPGLQDGTVLAYEWELPKHFVPWPGRTQIERTYVLLDLGISMCNPLWREAHMADGRIVAGVGAAHDEPHTWYIDLSTVTAVEGGYIVRDLFIDVIVPLDGRHYRTLDLDEFADAIDADELDIPTAVDGLRRRQRFLDSHLHAHREATLGWTDFPPAVLGPMARHTEPFGPVVRFES
jgi:hypothetical protein